MKYIKFYKNINIKDVPEVGGKNASLGEMYNKLSRKGVNLPNGFAVTSKAYFYFLDQAGIREKIENILKGLDVKNIRDLKKRGAQIRKLMLSAKFPKDLEIEILEAYRQLTEEVNQKRKHNQKKLIVAVRSSATAEDLPNASFAGQQETFLNIKGEKQVLEASKKCMASLYTDRAIVYRVSNGFDHMKVALSVGIHEMVAQVSSASGVMFTIHTETGFKNAITVSSIYGLGENIVQGRVNPDEFIVFKPTMKIITKQIGKKELEMVPIDGLGGKRVRNISVPEKRRIAQSITDKQVIQLAEWGMEIEKHYNKAMDIEWALDKYENKLYIIQARPETIHGNKDMNNIEEYVMEDKGRIIAKGKSVGMKIGSGKANKVMDLRGIETFKEGDVLVTEMTDPDWEPIMKMASAIVTDKGGRTCHAAIVSRELGVPCVVGTGNASHVIRPGQEITVSCAEGDEGKVYDKLLKFKIKKTNIKNLKRPKTKIMMNIASPDLAFSYSQIPNDGVGLARIEFIINNYIKIHPLALLNRDKLKDRIRLQVDALTKGYKNGEEYYIDKISQGVAMIAAAFYPKDVIIRLTDFKSNEYANLIGGEMFEPDENNPMIGWRGASRYYSPEYKEAFELELKAMRRVREDMGLVNVKLMIPFCRDIEEAKKVLAIMKKNGFERGKDGFEVYSMIEIPSNVILADQFAELFDGFSIGSNDLTQLTLGVDRDNHLVSHIYNEQNDAVKALIEYVVKAAKASKTKVGICGQAPSDYPEFAEFLVECGIDSMSLTPDTVVKTTILVNKKENKK